MITSRDRSRLRLRSGRSVAYEVWGEPSGETVFYWHGFPSSRLEGMLHAEAAQRTRTSLVALDRPGYGGSERARLTITEVAQDAVEIADASGVSKFGVVGVSGGAPYALACAAAVPDRVSRVALMAPLGPPDAPRYGMRPANKLMLSVAARPHWLFAALQRAGALVVRRQREKLVLHLAKTLPDHEEALVRNAELRRDFTSVLLESFAQKGAGAAADGWRLTRPWGVDFARVEGPVRIWHGLVDDIVPPGMGGHRQARLPDTTELTIAPLDGHFSVVRRNIDDALAWIATSLRDPTQTRA